MLAVLAAALWAAAPARADDTWTEPYPGVLHLHRTTGAPSDIHALIVNLEHPAVDMVVTAEADKYSTTSEFAGRYGAVVATNGDYADSTSDYVPYGICVANGTRWSRDNGRAPMWAALFDANDVGRIRTSPAETPAGTWNALGGTPVVVENGAAVDFGGAVGASDRHPRTGVGFADDGRRMIWVVVDGRRSGARGMTWTELGQLLVELGAQKGLNLDGGGSSTMYISAEGGVQNVPSDGSERTIINHLGLLWQPKQVSVRLGRWTALHSEDAQGMRPQLTAAPQGGTTVDLRHYEDDPFRVAGNVRVTLALRDPPVEEVRFAFAQNLDNAVYSPQWLVDGAAVRTFDTFGGYSEEVTLEGLQAREIGLLVATVASRNVPYEWYAQAAEVRYRRGSYWTVLRPDQAGFEETMPDATTVRFENQVDYGAAVSGRLEVYRDLDPPADEVRFSYSQNLGNEVYVAEVLADGAVVKTLDAYGPYSEDVVLSGLGGATRISFALAVRAGTVVPYDWFAEFRGVTASPTDDLPPPGTDAEVPAPGRDAGVLVGADSGVVPDGGLGAGCSCRSSGSSGSGAIWLFGALVFSPAAARQTPGAAVRRRRTSARKRSASATIRATSSSVKTVPVT
ncbi:MAG: phosphodiester glycosidase family protein [Deltaproteobacteria bacterium]|nr:phosphodiester glycosidase family protein [Deltaproteobacteria bacterium]